MGSNEVELLAIRRAIHLWDMHGNGKLIVKCDSIHAIAWAFGGKDPPWRLVNIVREITRMSLNKGILFIGRSGNCVADFLSKIGVHKRMSVVEFF